MGYIRRDIDFAESFRSNDYDDLRHEEVKQERCGLCTELWPSSMMRDNDGLRRCPDCYDTRGIFRKNEIRQYDNDRIRRKQTRPQISRMTLDDGNIAFIRSMTNVSGTRVLPSSPLLLSRGGAAVALTLTGGNFASSNTFTYSSGVSDNSAPSLTGTTVWTLSLVASGGMAAGEWHLTFNSHTYRNILRVR